LQAESICATCGTRTNGRKVTKGSILIELILWCCFIIPGLIYSVWRLTTKARVCHACGAATLVPLNTPVGQKLASDHLVVSRSVNIQKNVGTTTHGNQDAWASRGEMLGRLLRHMKARGTVATVFLIGFVFFGIYSIFGRSSPPIAATATACAPGNVASCQPSIYLLPIAPVKATTDSAHIDTTGVYDDAGSIDSDTLSAFKSAIEGKGYNCDTIHSAVLIKAPSMYHVVCSTAENGKVTGYDMEATISHTPKPVSSSGGNIASSKKAANSDATTDAGPYIPTHADDARADCMGPWMAQYEGSDKYRATCDANVASIRKWLDNENKPCDAIASLWLSDGINAIDCVVHDAPADPTGNRVVRYETRNGILKAVTAFQWNFDRKQVLGY
jgi:hypothetical protein